MLHKTKKAFTLTELIMIIVLVSVITAGSTAFIIQTISGAFVSQDITAALNLARMELEHLSNLEYNHADLGVGSDLIENYGGYGYDLLKEIEVVESGAGSENVKKISVSVFLKNEADQDDKLLAHIITYRASYVE